MTDTTNETGKKESEYKSINDGLKKMNNVDRVNDLPNVTEIILDPVGPISALSEIPFSTDSVHRYEEIGRVKIFCSTYGRSVTIVVPTPGVLE